MSNRKEKNEVQMSFWVPADLAAWLWAERRRRERSIRWIVMQALQQYRNRLDKKRSIAAATDEED